LYPGGGPCAVLVCRLAKVFIVFCRLIHTEAIPVGVGSKILLVDDSKFLRMANERALCRAGYEVCTAADGEEALKVANEKNPDLILLDMMLPKMSGPDVLRALKENSATADIPVIVLTSLSQKNEDKFIEKGAAAYFEKSTLELDKSSDRLVVAVETVLRRVQPKKRIASLPKASSAKAAR
jgi:CheY-like chemotaxis protein